MSDEEDSMSEGFSASEDEWKPNKDIKGGESSDDDDSDFEGSPLAEAASGGSGTSAGRKRGEPKARSAAKQTSSKKRTGLSLRAKLYNKYRPPPKTFSPPSGVAGKNSPSASTSRTNSKNATAPNESKSIKRINNADEDSGSSSDSSIDNYLVNPEDLDIQSSFFNVEAKPIKRPSVSPVPVFDCNAGLGNLTDSGSDDDQVEVKKDEKAFDFNNLLEYAKSLERVKESVAKHNAEESSKKSSGSTNIDTLDVYAVLALGEKQQNRSHNDGEDEDDEDDDDVIGNEQSRSKNQPSKLNKTKSTRIKRHTKTRPTSTVAANDTDDSDWEEVADTSEGIDTTATSSDISHIGSLEIHVDLPSRSREKKTKTQQDIEMAFKRRLNRDIKERQVLLHKASLLCHFGRTFFYNRLLNDTILMPKALKLLPSKSAYPPDRGTEIKYFQSMVTWFKSAIKLKTQNLYPEKSAAKTKTKAHLELLKQIEKKEARSKQDMIFIFIILLRGMGLQCRLIVNMQPMPLKPAQSDLLSLKLKKDDESDNKNVSVSSKKIKKEDRDTDGNTEAISQASSSKVKVTKQESTDSEHKKVAAKKNIKNPLTSDAKETQERKQQAKSKTIKKSKQSSSEDSEDVIKVEEKPKTSRKLANLKETEKRNNTKLTKSETCIKTEKVTKTNAKEKHIDEKTQASSTAANVKELKGEKNEENSKSKEKTIKGTEVKKTKTTVKSCLASGTEIVAPSAQETNNEKSNGHDDLESSQKENKTKSLNKPTLSRLKRTKAIDSSDKQEEKPDKRPTIEAGTLVIPKIVVQAGKDQNLTEQPSTSKQTRSTRSRSKSPQAHISTAFLLQNSHYKEKFPGIIQQNTNVKKKTIRGKSPINKAKISTDFLINPQPTSVPKRVLRSRQKTNEDSQEDAKPMQVEIPQLDGANDNDADCENENLTSKKDKKKRRPNIKKLKTLRSTDNSDEDFEPSPPKKPKSAPSLAKQDRRVLSSDDENDNADSAEKAKRKQTAGDMWIEVWCDVEEQWICVDIFKGKIHCVDTIRKSASPSLAYVFAFQNDLSIKDVTARYCPNWTTVVRKSRVDKAWLDTAICKYVGHRTKRDIKEDQELRRIHEEKPMPTAIGDYKNHPFYALERHLLKFEAIYPPNAPTLGYIRGEAVYSRDCVHTLHSREIWLKQARTVKLGEKPYKIVKARPKWDRITQTVIKDQPLEIFGYWQTQDYEPPTAENGLVPRNAYGNVELFKPSMLPKKTKHIRLPGLNRICKKLGIDCANAVVGFDFHQGACHPTYDGFIVCEEFEDQVVAAWHQDQEEQERKEQEKYEARVYGNWKKLIRGLLIRERLKIKYNF
ncbi:DNA repair protein complementing XP-C cells homolog isoform X1 [Lucilia sericata]|uniref:DNA repair protein complementing XP-C cells homolog isoform X1 n=1 Tax=Lucilia sericata TaxID=13632 RepID=UPI0018A84A9D|nr:DNA repair protein complementing XP-C cells homolog isoform X1 [Lucilia sericata]